MPGGTFEDGSGWLCKVCSRGTCHDRRPWSRFGCEYGRRADRRVAGLLGARRIIPLGQHSIMNDLGLSLAETSETVQTAFRDQLLALHSGWDALHAWNKARVTELSLALGAELVGGTGTASFMDWHETYPWTPDKSASSYIAYLQAHEAWVLEIDPRTSDIAWLAATEVEA